MSNTIASRVTRPKPRKDTQDEINLAAEFRPQKVKILTAYAKTISSQNRSRSLIAIVLIAAIDLINSSNDDLIGVTIAQLAKHTGTTRSGIYRYFSDVSGILYNVLKELRDAGLSRDMFTRRELAIMAYYDLLPPEEEPAQVSVPLLAEEKRAAA